MYQTRTINDILRQGQWWNTVGRIRINTALDSYLRISKLAAGSNLAQLPGIAAAERLSTMAAGLTSGGFAASALQAAAIGHSSLAVNQMLAGMGAAHQARLDRLIGTLNVDQLYAPFPAVLRIQDSLARGVLASVTANIDLEADEDPGSIELDAPTVARAIAGARSRSTLPMSPLELVNLYVALLGGVVMLMQEPEDTLAAALPAMLYLVAIALVIQAYSDED